MNTSLVPATITYVGERHCLARSKDGREFCLHNQQGPMGFLVNNGEVVLDYACGKENLTFGSQVLLKPDRKDEHHKNFRTNGWGLTIRAKGAWTAYADQPVYVVLQRTRRVLANGRFGTWGKWVQTLTARADVICQEAVRDGLRVSRVDRLAPDYFTQGFHTQTKFALENGTEVNDPRPFPKHTGNFYRVMRHIRGLPAKEIARGDAATIAYEYPRTEGDELKNHGDVTFTWDKGNGIDDHKQPIWIPHHEDPRTPQLKVEPLPLGTIDTNQLARLMMGNGLSQQAA